MRNTRPADLKKMIQGLIILTLLCWATQTLVSQWGFGGEVFITARTGLVIELKNEATVGGNEIRLNQIARWPDAAGDVMEQTGDLIVGRFAAGRSTMAMPMTRMRVVCTLGDTILTLEPTRALTSVDLPAFGAPMTATRPQWGAASVIRNR